MSEPRSSTRSRPGAKTTGFGFDPAVSRYHFAVRIRSSGAAEVIERFAPSDDESDELSRGEAVKVTLSADCWGRIAEPVAQEFNNRLIAEGYRSGRWLKHETPLAPYFGKELTLLAWAVEDADPTAIPVMIANWRGLAPEERWWFYTTINANPNVKDRGWRKAIKIAFAGNPIDVSPSALLANDHQATPPAKRTRAQRAAPKQREVTQGRLFGDPEYQ